MKRHIESSEQTKHQNPEETSLLSFIIKTKNGDYAKIEESSLPYSRIAEQSENIEFNDDNLFYGIS